MRVPTDELETIVIDGLSFDVIRDPADLPPTWEVFAPVVEEPADGGRLLAVGYRGRVIAYAVADARSGRWCDIEVVAGPGAGRPLGAVAYEEGSQAAAFWERVTHAVDVACGVLFGSRRTEDSEAPAPGCR